MKSFFFHKLLLGDIKLSNLEHRNRKLSVHDRTDHIKTLLSFDKYHETRNINTSQAAMLLVPGHNCATLLVPVHKVHNVLTVFQLKTTWRLGNVQFVLIVAVVKVLLQEDSFLFLFKKYQQVKKEDTCWQIASRFLPIADIINDHGLSYHLYADDTQLYITFKSTSLNDIQQVKLRVECCVRDIDEWMIRNYLKLNQDKTDLVVICSRFHPMPDIGHITVGSECIAPRDSVRNLRVQFDSIFSFEEHIKNICKSSFYHLRNIAKIRKYLSQDTCEILVHAFISSKLDHCNSLLHGLPKYLLARLQAVQNAAARVVTLTPKHVHITPILINLHWLQVEFRITFKVL